MSADYPLEDGTTSGYYTTLGGRGTYPYTVVLDGSGISLQEKAVGRNYFIDWSLQLKDRIGVEFYLELTRCIEKGMEIRAYTSHLKDYEIEIKKQIPLLYL